MCRYRYQSWDGTAAARPCQAASQKDQGRAPFSDHASGLPLLWLLVPAALMRHHRGHSACIYRHG